MDMKRIAKLKNADEGFTLVEMIAVIAIISVLVGIMSLSVIMIFSRDAERVAKKINDELTDARLYSMSKPGEFKFTLTTTSTGVGNSMKLECTDGGTTTVFDQVVFDKKVEITFDEDYVDLSSTSPSDKTVEVIFSKSNGSVKSIKVDGTAVSVANKVYKAHVKAVRNSKSMETFLVTTTGRHYVE